MGTTTIKVSTELRDRINRDAQERGLPAAGLIESLLDAYERRRRMESFGRQDQAFVDAIDSGKQPDANLRCGLVAAYVAFAAEQSSRERKAISLKDLEGAR
ncbi:MAG TPA: hypothetical protein PK395_12270 [bacterium]|nr:hypothetical protein [bacterium]